MRPPFRARYLKHTTRIPQLPRAPPQTLIPRRIVTTSCINAAPADIPNLFVTPGSSRHNSLPSFLEYASRNNLASDRTVYIGTHYEYIAQLALQRLGFSLLRTGKRADAGIDLVGHWVLPPLREPLPVIIQCKSRKLPCSPKHIRELEGSFQGIPPGWRSKDVLGLLVSTQTTTKGVFDALCASRWPLGFMKISVDGNIEQFVWNKAASDKGLEGVGATARYTPRITMPEVLDEAESEDIAAQDAPKGRKKTSAKTKIAGTKQDIQLTWMGTPISPQRHDLDPETLKLMAKLSSPEDKETTSFTQKVKQRKKQLQTGVQATTTRALGSTKKRLVMGEIPKKRGRPPGSKNRIRSEPVPDG